MSNPAPSDELTPLSPWWRRAVLMVMTLGFTLLTIVTMKTYAGAPPIPDRVVDGAGAIVFGGDDIRAGQAVFLKYGLMEHGTVWGHGAYLGPDYSAEYLHRTVEIGQDALARSRFHTGFDALDAGQAAVVVAELKSELKRNAYEPTTGTLQLSEAEAASFHAQRLEWRAYFDGPTPPPGLPRGFIHDERELDQLSAFFAWTAWATTALRPGTDYSYTNNWPYDPTAGNTPTASAYLWSAMSLVVLLGGIGVILTLFGRFSFLGWGASSAATETSSGPITSWSLTPSQRVLGLYFIVVALLFLAQAALGGVIAHYRVEPGGFYGFDLARYLPFNLARTWHLQLAIFWIATSWVAGGLLLAPIIGGGDPKGQRVGVIVLLVALAIVVFGSLFGEMAGIRGALGGLWFWLGHQGSEYLDLGRFWQILLATGLVGWLVLMFRALRPAFSDPRRRELAALFFAASVAIPLFYVPALFYGPHTNFAIIDNWRFWIIHLWVEGFFELFATVLVAVMFHLMGLVTSKSAARIIYLDAILYLAGGIVGTGHHWYFTGQSTLNMGLASCFSALEVVPLTLLTLDAWDFIRFKNHARASGERSLVGEHIWAIRFLIAVGVWNFVGAGVFGFLINLPIVSYFEMGTTLTPNHGHAAMFGVFGMLALAVLVFCMRALYTDEAWHKIERHIKRGFWGLNIGLGLMLALDLFPAGVLQLWDVIAHSYWHARRLGYLMGGMFHILEALRMVADIVFLVLGAAPIAWATVLLVTRRERRRPLVELTSTPR
ncbi:MAG: nitric-oxide reductase large subunit [Polyangia bacterium]